MHLKNTIILKDIVDENFQDYKKTSMFIATCRCSWKCCIDCGRDITMCQNSSIAKQPSLEVSNDIIVKRYLNNPITSAIVIGGLEPFDQFEELYSLIKDFREVTDDDIVIYSGYRAEEIFEEVTALKKFNNIIIKFGRYVPNDNPHYDAVLGINLASSNQYAVKIS